MSARFLTNLIYSKNSQVGKWNILSRINSKKLEFNVLDVEIDGIVVCVGWAGGGGRGREKLWGDM